ncbi:MAG: ATP-binding protein [Candidatus Aminicenantaceae bacterium]
MKAKFKPINWKLKQKVVFHVLVIGLISVFGLTVLYINAEKDLIKTLAKQKTELVGYMIDCNVRHQMMKGDTEAIPINLERLTQSSTINRLRILNLEGVILSSSQRMEIGTMLPPEDRAVVRQLFIDLDPTELFAIKPVSGYKSYIALKNRSECAECHTQDTPFNGILEVKLDESLEVALLQRKRNQGILIAFTTLLLLTFVIFRLYARVINRPLLQLKESMRKVEEGDLDIRLEAQKLDEFGDLAKSFSAMVHRLKLANQEIEELHGQQIEKAGHLASLGELAAGLAHEIKNPIAGIKGSLEIIRDRTPEEDPQREIFSEILRQTGKIFHIIQDLLDYAKPRELSMRPADPDTCVKEAINLARGLIQNKNIQFNFNGLSQGSTVVCDADKLQEVILNLLMNGITAIEKEGEITVDLYQAQDGRIEVHITDTGAGIKQEHMDRVFQPFFTTRKQGTGLGLSICKQIVEAHRGQITVDSTLGQGTTFILSLPLELHSESDAK